MLKYVCISDLHAGARTCLLEDITQGQRGTLSPLAEDVVAAMGAFLGAAGSGPQLILLGDVLDLQFSDRSLSFSIASQFLKALRETGQLAKEVLVTGGNHDHALWTDARLSIEAETIVNPDRGVSYLDATPAFSAVKSAQSRLTNALMSDAGFGSVDFRYPNIGFSKEDRAVMLHHGHFVEAEYRLMSRLKDTLSGHSRDRVSAAEVAAENAGWIDFFWSTVGDAGLGPEAEKLYQRMLTSAGFRHLSEGWARKLAAAVTDLLPISKNLETQQMMRRAAQVALDVSVGAFRDRERYAEVDSLTEGGREGLKWYLEGAVDGQLCEELAQPPKDLTFVFGHTHKPFARRLTLPSRSLPVKVYNTGGWTLNGPRLDNAEGAAMILIDEDLNVASLRLFSTPRNGKVRPAHLEMLNDGGASGLAFAKAIGQWLDASETQWARVAHSAEGAYARRQEYLLHLSDFEGDNPRGFAAQ